MSEPTAALRVALVSPGAMGSAVGARLVEAGCTVLTSLAGRSEASRARAQAAGMIDATDAELVGCDIILSILPPGDAIALAERLLPLLAARAEKPLYVDANALSPATKKTMATLLAQAGCNMVDGAIIGGPPRGERRPGAPAYTTLLLSGEGAEQAAVLGTDACPAKVMDGGIGAASALKMCFGGINKGTIGMACALLLAAERHGADEALRDELMRGQPDLFLRFGNQMHDMLPKAYRWVAEMREIAAFLGEDDPAGAEVFRGIAGLYERLAADFAGARSDSEVLGRAVRP